jgi:YD repeat-containing protein
VVTGWVFTTPVLDLVLPGPLPLLLYRGYSTSAVERDIGLGHGWTHSLSWEIQVRRRTLVILRPDGTETVRELPLVGVEVDIGNGVKLRRDRENFIIVDENGCIHLFSPASPKGSTWRLDGLADLRGNRIVLAYEAGLLTEIVDSVGRVVRVRRHPDGHIAAFEVNGGSGRWARFRSYEYNANADLIASVDGEGCRTEFTYEENRLVHQRFPSGLCIHHRYDGRGRCIETWCDYAGSPDPAVADHAPAVLADRTTRAKGVLHVKLEYHRGFTEVIDSRQVRRYEDNSFGKVDKATSGRGVATCEYDEQGYCTSFTDAGCATTHWRRDATGQLLATTDPCGASTTYEYNARGNLSRAIDALGRAVGYAYDPFSNLIEVVDGLGMVLTYDYDARGNIVRATMPDGAVTLFKYDTHGNLIELIEPNGKPRRIHVDELGRVSSFTNEEGLTTSFTYNGRGQLRKVFMPDGGIQELEYDADGQPTGLRNADGAVLRFHWGGYRVIHRVDKPDGTSIRLYYDRECDLVRVVNSAGEAHEIARDTAGRIIEERTFDGRRCYYRLDLAGRFERINGPYGGTTFVRDPCGRVLERMYPDGSVERFEYDPVGHLLSADNGEVRCDFSYDVRGRLIRETQTSRGATHAVENEYGLSGRRVVLRTSSGHVERTERNAMGLPSRIFLDQEDPISFVWNGLDAEVQRMLPHGGGCWFDTTPAVESPSSVSLRSEARTPEPASRSGSQGCLGKRDMPLHSRTLKADTYRRFIMQSAEGPRSSVTRWGGSSSGGHRKRSQPMTMMREEGSTRSRPELRLVATSLEASSSRAVTRSTSTTKSRV